MSRIVVALGGNALGNNPVEQLRLVKQSAKSLVDLVEAGHTLVIAHGNGPQVGMINLAFETAKNDGKTPEMPFSECGAMSQGYIGYHLQNALYQELKVRGITKNVATVVTQVIVDEADEAFKNPTKPIGAFYSKEEASLLAEEKGYVMKEDAGRGYRRVIASPLPKDVVEKEVIQTLIKENHIVISVGGGGIPVISRQDELIGVAAVIDKDFASETLAEIVDADLLVILTAVDQVAIHYGKPSQVNLNEMSVDDALKYIEEGHFAPGSMLPKVKAIVKFVQSKPGRRGIIASLEKANLALEGRSGTSIY